MRVDVEADSPAASPPEGEMGYVASVRSSQDSGASGLSARTLVATVAILALILGALFAWRSLRAGPRHGAARPPVAVAAMTVQAEDAPASLQAIGSIRAVRQVVLTPEVEGRVVDIRFTSGETVKAGTVLVQLNDAPERANREAAQAKAEFAKDELGRSKELAPTGAEPRELLVQRGSDLEQAVAAVHQLDAQIAQKQIRAPFTGEIGLRKVDLGQHLNPGDTVATLTDLSALYVEFALPQQELGRVARGASVSVTTDAWPGRTFVARVNAVEPQIGQDTRNVTVQAVLANPDGALRPGMYINAALNLPPQQGAIVVPATAIQTSASGDDVIVIRGSDAARGGHADFVPVTTGRRLGDRIVVTSGLKAGDVVVTEGQLRVQPGAQVTVTGGR
jgi:multidrug efflux system membrane fusion protein